MQFRGCTSTPHPAGYTASECDGASECTDAGACTSTPYPGSYNAIESFGGIISFNTDKCWYLDSGFCAPLHKLKEKMGTQNALSMVQGIAFGVLALASLLLVGLIIRVARHQCYHGGMGDEKNYGCKRKMRASADEVASWGVLPMTGLLLMLWVPISLQNNVFDPCWQCFDFEAAAVHEIGHILGLNHPDSMGTVVKDASTGETFPVGWNSYSAWAANDGQIPFDDPEASRFDWCSNPWDYVFEGSFPDADDKNAETGVRQSIMYSLTAHNPKVCLTPDDLEAINTLYPRCDGRGVAMSTVEWNCGKTYTYIGAVRVMVYIFIPIVFLMCFQLCILSCLQHYHEDVKEELEGAVVEQKKKAQKAQRRASEAKERAVHIESVLKTQMETEDSRVEARAQEMAAQMIQSKMRGHMTRKKTKPQLLEASLKRKASAHTEGGATTPAGLPPADASVQVSQTRV